MKCSRNQLVQSINQSISQSFRSPILQNLINPSIYQQQTNYLLSKLKYNSPNQTNKQTNQTNRYIDDIDRSIRQRNHPTHAQSYSRKKEDKTNWERKSRKEIINFNQIDEHQQSLCVRVLLFFLPPAVTWVRYFVWVEYNQHTNNSFS